MISQLKDIGLSDKEAKVYLTMLELGPSPVQHIAAQAGVNRPAAYVHIDALKKLGLVSTVTKGKKQLFQAESPEQLEIILSRQITEAKLRKEAFAELMPQLRTIFQSAGEKPQVRFFEGVEGLLRMQEDFLTTKRKELVGIFCLDDVQAVLPDQKKTFSPRRIEKGITSKSIYTSSKGKTLFRRNEKNLSEAKFVKQNELPIDVDITIYDNKVSIAALKGKISGTIIEHKELADSFRAIFNYLWKTID